MRLDRGKGTALRLAQAWISDGGVAANGIKYAPPSYGTAWGTKGCPLLSREVREHHKNVNLPQSLQRVFGIPLTVDQLDSAVLERFSNDVVLQPPPREFRDLLYKMPVLATQVVVPAGIPLRWIEDLPITGRTRAAVRRAFREAGEDDFLQVPMQASQFLRIHSVGVTTLNELTCVIESAELGWTAEKPTVEALQSAERLAAFNSVGVTTLNELTRVIESAELGWTAEKPIVEALQSVDRLAAFNGHLCQFARWAMAETDARSFGEAVIELIQTGATNEVWESIAWVNLTDLSTQAPHPYAVVDKWVEGMDPRFQTIFRARIPFQTDGVTTLEELGGRFGVTRERIRQIEAKLRRRLTRFLASDAALPVRWRAATLRRMVGVAAPLDVVEHLMKSPPEVSVYPTTSPLPLPSVMEETGIEMESYQAGGSWTYRICEPSDDDHPLTGGDASRIPSPFDADQMEGLISVWENAAVWQVSGGGEHHLDNSNDGPPLRGAGREPHLQPSGFLHGQVCRSAVRRERGRNCASVHCPS